MTMPICRALVDEAEAKLNAKPPQIPHDEHRQLHLSIYAKLNNPFVQGLLEAYWDMYEAVGLNVYNDIAYHKKVWDYHRRIVHAIKAGNLAIRLQTIARAQAAA